MMLPRLGIIAGGGCLPLEIIDFCKSSARPFVLVALKNHANNDIDLNRIPHKWFRLGAAGSIIEFLREQNVKHLVMAGTIRRPTISSLRPDLWTAKFFAKTGAAALGDNGLLSNLIKVLQDDEGFTIIGPDELLPSILAYEGSHGSVNPSDKDLIDISIGIDAALNLGRNDIGQAVIARNGKIIGLEDNKGTDHMLLRAIASKSNFSQGVLVKMAKPNQEVRADLPSIGPQTIINTKNAGLTGVAIEKNMSLILKKELTVKVANELGIFVVGVSRDPQTEIKC